MSSVNKAIILGHLGRDPEVRFGPDGSAVANLSIATSSSWKDKATGDRKEETEWHRIVLYGRAAEVCQQYLKKGSSVYIEGRLKTRKWTDKNGQDKYTTEIVGDSMKMLGGKTEQAQALQSSQAPKQTPIKKSNFDAMDDDIPF